MEHLQCGGEGLQQIDQMQQKQILVAQKLWSLVGLTLGEPVLAGVLVAAEADIEDARV